MTDRAFYVYLHRKETDNSVFYIGKGKGGRAWSKSGRNSHWKRTVKKHGYTVEVFRKNMSEVCALSLEVVLIGIRGIENLANHVLGGGGISGWRHSEKTKLAIGMSSRSRPAHENSIKALIENRPKSLTETHKAKLSAAKKGKPRGPLPCAVKDKIRQSHYGIRPTKETLEKMRAAKIGQRKREKNNKFDPTIRVFHHEIYGEFVGVSYDLRSKYNIGAPCIRAIITGRQKTAKGWRYKGEPK